MSNERIEITIEEILAAMAYADARFWDAHSAALKTVKKVYSL
jgi:hypothetical protein